MVALVLLGGISLQEALNLGACVNQPMQKRGNEWRRVDRIVHRHLTANGDTRVHCDELNGGVKLWSTGVVEHQIDRTTAKRVAQRVDMLRIDRRRLVVERDVATERTQQRTLVVGAGAANNEAAALFEQLNNERADGARGARDKGSLTRRNGLKHMRNSEPSRATDHAERANEMLESDGASATIWQQFNITDIHNGTLSPTRIGANVGADRDVSSRGLENTTNCE
jgi:hypothetical protein